MFYARHTIGPDKLFFGEPGCAITFERGKWREVDLDDAQRAQLELPDRVAEYGIETADMQPAAIND